MLEGFNVPMLLKLGFGKRYSDAKEGLLWRTHQIRLAPKPVRRHIKRTEATLSTKYCLGQLVFFSAVTRIGYLLKSRPNLSNMF